MSSDKNNGSSTEGLIEGREFISTYTRAQALADGVLIDVTERAKEAGISVPIAMTRAVWNQYVELTEAARRAGNDVEGRIWDILWMLRAAVLRQPDTDEIHFQLYVVTDHARQLLVTLKAICGPGDHDEPVITIMLPDEAEGEEKGMNPNDTSGRDPPKQNNDICPAATDFAEPEVELLRAVFRGAPFVVPLARAPGGWRTLSAYELDALGLTPEEKNGVVALQVLVQRSYPELPKLKVPSPSAIGPTYEHRLGGLMQEVMLAVALDGRNNVIGEVEVATGGAHSIAIRPRDVLRPLLRIGARAFILVHNHPSGDPTPSMDDLMLTRHVAECASAIGLPLVDHIIVAGRGGGFTSFVALGLYQGEVPL